MSGKKGHLFIIWAPEEWERYVRRPHWTGLSHKVEILVIEPPVGLLACWLHFGRLISLLKHGTAIRRNNAGICFIRPISFFTFGICYRFPLLASLDRWVLRLAAKKIVKKSENKFNATVVFVTKIMQYYIADLIKADVICYLITDEYYTRPSESSIDRNSRLYKKAATAEYVLKNSADMVFASSRNLLKSRRGIFKNVRYLPNIADYDHFSGAHNTKDEIPEEIGEIPGNRIGYVGNINELIDLGLICAIAEKYSNWSVILIGTENAGRKYRNSPMYLKIKSMPNVYFMKRKPYERLPSYIRGLDVCIMPFKLNAWMECSFPNKIFQYLASGKPIVSTDFPAVRDYNRVIEIARDIDNFILMIEKCICHYSDQKKKARMKLAKENSIDRHADLLIGYILETLSMRSKRSNY
jgi:glycosyltransferase involved in cell wall biosynthesis